MLGVCVQKIGLFLAGYLPAIAFANDAVMEHHDPIAPVILWVTFIFYAL